MSFTETLVVLVVAMIVFGPKRMPEMARKLGKWMGMLRRASDEFKRQIMTMDQTVGDTLNAATSDLDRLLPTDEELGQAADALSYEPDAPAFSPDDAWEAEPVPGGLPEEEPEPAAVPTPSPSADRPAVPPTQPADPARRPADPPAGPRSLGLSPTRKGGARG